MLCGIHRRTCQRRQLLGRNLLPCGRGNFKERRAVCGAAFDEKFELAQTVVYDREGLAKLRGSKYLQSTSKKTYREIKRVLDQGKPALFCGCPCQVAGLYGYLGRDYEKLFTLDLMCHGGPSPMVFQKYLKEVHGGHDITYVGFRDKDYFGWSTEMTVKYADGKIYRKTRDKDLFYRAFLPCLSVRPHCQICKYSRLSRQGDMTLADFWEFRNTIRNIQTEKEPLFWWSTTKKQNRCSRRFRFA